MTVCIAAICDNGGIVGATDRMMTSGDIEFEPDFNSLEKLEFPGPLNENYTPNQKIFALTNYIVGLTAGDAGLESEIMQEVLGTMTSRINSNAAQWWTVKETVALYLHHYDMARKNRAQTAIFAPFGLTETTFLSRQYEMSKDFINEIMTHIRRFESNFRAEHGVETIIVGMDKTQDLYFPHIYSIYRSLNGDSVTCCDSIGFAAIGSGFRHAESQFMLAGHTRSSSIADTLLLTYMAKKRSEVAPGVGEGTDMFVIGPGSGQFAMLDRIKNFDFDKIGKIYKKVSNREHAALKTAKDEMKVYLQEFYEKRELQQQKSEAEQAAKLRAAAPPIEAQKPTENKGENDTK